MKYRNPILRGCYPDPSICRVDDTFYLVNSSFEFFPGIPVSTSKDLIHWEQIGHCITRNSQINLVRGSQSNTGTFAPTIRYKDGIFYMVVTNVALKDAKGLGNFYLWTENPAGEWSEPIFLNTPGIDPSFFFDDDGKDYYIGTCDDGIYVVEIDLKTGKLLSDRRVLWKGTGGAYPEGPHLYKKDGWYYLMISEGGTERCHMITMARSKSLDGCFEPCPNNPVMTNRSLLLPLQAIGHADLVSDLNGNWWAVCLGTRVFDYHPRHNLGRETMLVPVDWSGDWPVFGDNGKVYDIIETDKLPVDNISDNLDFAETVIDNFEGNSLGFVWNYIYNPDYSLYKVENNGLHLWGNEKSLRDADTIAWVGRRQQHHECSATVTLEFPCSIEGEEAGMTIFTNNKNHYEIALSFSEGVRKLIFRRQLGTLEKVEREIPYDKDKVQIRLDANLQDYKFSFWVDDKWEEIGRGETRYLVTEVGGHFTGNYIGLYSCGNGNKCENPATFSNFVYEGK